MAAEFPVLRRSGAARIVVLIADNHASRLAHRMALALLRPGDALEIVTVVSSAGARAYGDALLAPYLAQHTANSGGASTGQQQQEEELQQQQGGGAGGAPKAAVTGTVLEKGDARLGDAVEAYLSTSRADLCVMGSHHLAATGARDDPIPASGSFALRLARALRACPLLVAKVNASGHYLKSGSSGAGLRVMVDVRPDSRHFLEFVMNRLEPGKDGLFLAARPPSGVGSGSGAYGSDGGASAWAASDTLRRMMSAFCTQAGVSGFYAAQRPMKDASVEGLVTAARADAVDVIALHAPPCRVLPDAIVEALKTARAAVLVYRAKPAAGAGAGATAAMASAGSAGPWQELAVGERDDGGDQQQ